MAAMPARLKQVVDRLGRPADSARQPRPRPGDQRERAACWPTTAAGAKSLGEGAAVCGPGSNAIAYGNTAAIRTMPWPRGVFAHGGLRVGASLRIRPARAYWLETIRRWMLADRLAHPGGHAPHPDRFRAGHLLAEA